MSLKSWGEYKILAHLITKLQEEKAYKMGKMVGFKVNQQGDKRYKESRSEDVQKRVALTLFTFFLGFMDEVIHDWTKEEKEKLKKKLKRRIK